MGVGHWHIQQGPRSASRALWLHQHLIWILNTGKYQLHSSLSLVLFSRFLSGHFASNTEDRLGEGGHAAAITLVLSILLFDLMEIALIFWLANF